jgi:hypothetical protein
MRSPWRPAPYRASVERIVTDRPYPNDPRHFNKFNRTSGPKRPNNKRGPSWYETPGEPLRIEGGLVPGVAFPMSSGLSKSRLTVIIEPGIGRTRRADVG